MQKAMLFIDGSLLYRDWKTMKKDQKFDLEKLIDLIANKKPENSIKRTYYYATKLHDDYSVEERQKQEQFFRKLRTIPRFEIRYGRLQKKFIEVNMVKNQLNCNSCRNPVIGCIKTYTDKGTDVNIAVDMFSFATKDNYDVAILFSRDGDFKRVIDEVKELGKDVILVVFDSMKDKVRDLWDAVDDWIVLDQSDCNRIVL